ncbi:MAG: hypothetical protein KGJ06_05475 [Pseudomonadota bacterium]|nr:hypothetical protein [Pseudomonadota bacterium]
MGNESEETGKPFDISSLLEDPLFSKQMAMLKAAVAALKEATGEGYLQALTAFNTAATAVRLEMADLLYKHPRYSQPYVAVVTEGIGYFRLEKEQEDKHIGKLHRDIQSRLNAQLGAREDTHTERAKQIRHHARGFE